jgi:hypothetical protein
MQEKRNVAVKMHKREDERIKEGRAVIRRYGGL